MKKRRYFLRGQTLMELVIAIGVVAIVASALAAAVTSSLRYGQASRFRSRAVKLAQEGIELARTLRDTSTWSTFEGYATTGTGSWCLSDVGVWTQDTSGGDCPITEGSTFWRSVAFTWNAIENRMEILVTVSWGERNSASTVNLHTYLTRWK